MKIHFAHLRREHTFCVRTIQLHNMRTINSLVLSNYIGFPVLRLEEKLFALLYYSRIERPVCIHPISVATAPADIEIQTSDAKARCNTHSFRKFRNADKGDFEIPLKSF